MFTPAPALDRLKFKIDALRLRREDLLMATRGQFFSKSLVFAYSGASKLEVKQGPIDRRHIEEILLGVPPKETYWLVCGPAGMMEIATDGLLDIGVPAEHILYERFDYAAGRSALHKRRRNQALAVVAAALAAAGAFALR